MTSKRSGFFVRSPAVRFSCKFYNRQVQIIGHESRTVSNGFFLDGRWLEEGEIVDVRAPYDGTLIAHVYKGRREHAEMAIAAAVKAFGADTVAVLACPEMGDFRDVPK